MRSIQGLFVSTLIFVLGFGAAAEAQQQVSFRRHILPILQSNCLKCHKATYKDEKGRNRKPKSGLRLDGKGWILLGGENGATIVPGNPTQSPLYVRVSLDPDDDDIMPAKGDALSKKQVALIKNWIAQGAVFGSWVGKSGPGANAVKTAQAAASITKLSTPTLRVYAEIGTGMKPAPSPAIERAAGQKCQVVPVTPKSPLLRVAFVSNEASVGDSDLAKLEQLASHITHLGLAKTRITDGALVPVSRMRKLTRLDLNQTAITDEGLKSLTTLSELRHLNLHSTDVTDEGIQVLGQLPKLERLYLWNTKVTKRGVQNIRRLLPRTKISYELVLPRPDPAAGTNSRRRRR